MFIELVSRLVGASGAEAVISPNRRDYDAAAPMPTGTTGPLTALPAPPTELTTRAPALTKKKISTLPEAFSAFTGIVEIMVGTGDRLVLQSGTNVAAGVASTASSVVALRPLAANWAGPSRRKSTDVASLRMTDGKAAAAPFHQRRGMVCRGGARASGAVSGS
jgi:hypothetical protein